MKKKVAKYKIINKNKKARQREPLKGGEIKKYSTITHLIEQRSLNQQKQVNKKQNIF